MKNTDLKEEILPIPFVEKIREEANKTIAEEVKGFGLDKKQTEVSEGQVRHIIDAYNRFKKGGKIAKNETKTR